MSNGFGIDTAFNTVVSAENAALLDFAIPRIGTFGYGSTGTTAYYNKPLSVDGGFLSTVRNVQGAGKAAGCYIFSYAWNVTAAEAEANRVCDYLDANNVTLDVAVFFDWERTGAGTYGSYEMVTAAGVNVTAQLVRDMTLAFMAVCERRGRRSGWYQSLGDSQAWWTAEIIAQQRSRNRLFWLAQWGSSYGLDCDIWQYRGDTVWNGISCDLNEAVSDRVLDGGSLRPNYRTPSLFWLFYKSWNPLRRFDRWKF